MSDQFVAEIRMFGFNFPPKGWALCNGQLLPISQNTALFSLLGTTYGGNGTTNFALPNLAGSAPLDFGQGPTLSDRIQGETGGEQVVTLIQSEMPSHSHPLGCGTAPGTTASPAGDVWAAGRAGRQAVNLYAPSPGAGPAMSPSELPVVGGNLPHNNMPPFLVVNFCIALQGIYPAHP